MKKLSTLLITSTFLLFTAVSCNDNEPEPLPGDTTVAVTAVSLNPTTASLVVGGETLTLTATISPENATNQSVTWSSSNTTVATVLNGVITAVAEGTATITVTTQDGNRTATSAITVVTAPIPVESVSLNETEVTLEIGDEFTLIATVLPENATNQNITWTSSDNAIATVEYGVVTAIAEGTAIITVTTEDGGFTATSEVEVTPAPIRVESVTLTTTSAVYIGGTITLTATILPETATNRNVTWQSSDITTATVLNGVVTGVATGTTTITVTTEDGGHTATSTLTVTLENRCNVNTPGWGESLGTISWGTIGNTNIESGTSTITGTDGRPNQIWSGAVFASACADKTTFDGGDWQIANFNADCRRAHTELTGHFFSWCAVVRFADQLCPYPWRVPTRFDFSDLDLNLGGTGNNRLIGGTPEQLEWYTASEGTGSSPQIGGTWGGARFTGNANIPTHNWSRYWSQSEASATNAFNLEVATNDIRPQFTNVKNLGFALRCVRN